MRTREDQIEELRDLLDAPNEVPDETDNILLAQERILEAEQRGYERAKAECAADTRRLKWLLSRTHYGIPGFDPKVSGRSPSELKADLIRAIDAAMEGGE